jgi:hypothetical protein
MPTSFNTSYLLSEKIPKKAVFSYLLYSLFTSSYEVHLLRFLFNSESFNNKLLSITLILLFSYSILFTFSHSSYESFSLFNILITFESFSKSFLDNLLFDELLNIFNLLTKFSVFYNCFIEVFILVSILAILFFNSETHIKNFIKSLQSIDLKKENINFNNIDFNSKKINKFES